MNKFIAAIMRAPKRAAGIAMLVAVVLVPAALFAWGPDRPTFTMASPADYVTFNSIVDNPDHGDERNFVQIKEDTAPNSSYTEDVALQPGKTYDVYAFYHNNAKTSLNTVPDGKGGFKGIATGAFMRAQMPATVKAGDKARITAFVGATNANPGQVWDEAYGSAAGDYALRYVSNSAVIHSNGAVNGKTLPDSLFTTGTPLGYDALDGKVPGCTQYAGYVIFKFTVDQPNFEVTKEVSKDGANAYSKSVTINPGDQVQYKIQYKNTGTTQQNDVVIRDALPAGMTYVNDSTYVSNSKTNSQWVKSTINDVSTPTGHAMGAYAPAGNAYLKFTAKVVDNDKLEKCGVNTLVNTATAVTHNGNKSDTANVVVSKTCVPPAPNYLCNYLTIEKISKTSFKFSTNYTVENATFKSVTYVIRDAQGKEIARTTNPVYDQTTVGKYSVEALVTVTVNGVDKTVSSDKCKQPFEVIETIVYCKPGIMVGDSRCTPCTVPGKENLPKDSPLCVTATATTTTVTELPKTGMTENIVSFLGLGALVASTAYYVTSRRAALLR